MTREYIQERVHSLGKWYQRVNLDGVWTTKITDTGGDHVWEKIKTFLPESLEGKRVLDLGCNAGYYSIQSSILGANEVVGIEIDPRHYEQATFVKEFYEEKLNKSLNVRYINMDISDINKLGKFDYVYAIAILYHIGTHKFGKYTKQARREQALMIDKLCMASDNFIVRTMKMENRTTEYYAPMFERNGFRLESVIDEPERQLVNFVR